MSPLQQPFNPVRFSGSGNQGPGTGDQQGSQVGVSALGDAQLLCFAAGANSIFYGDKLLTTANPDGDADMALLARLGLRAGQPVPRP